MDEVIESMALASFVDGLAVQILFLNKAETKRAKQELVLRYLKRNFAIPRRRGKTAK